MNTYKLLTPGPLTTTDTVKEEMLVDRCTWDDDYKAVTQKIRRQLLQLGHVSEDDYTAVLMQGSGTFGVESVLSSVVGDEDKVLICSNGAYGVRMTRICDRNRIPYVHYAESYDHIPDPARVARLLAQDPAITHVAVVHSETTSGILNDIQSVGKVVRDAGRTFIVDAMSSFGGVDIPVSDWGIDFLVSSANKCIQGVPGFSFILCRRDKLLSSEGKARALSLDLLDQWKGMAKDGKWRFTSPTHVAMVHSETTSGILNDIQSVGKVVRDAGRTFIVDAMSSFGGVDIPVADWGIDFLVSSANKCIQGVPGFSFILCRRDKLLASEGKARSLSLDLLDQWKGMEKDGKWRFTSPTHVVLAFSKALDELAQEGGIPARSRRYTENNRLLIEKMRAMGFATYIDGSHQGPIITTFFYPAGVSFRFEEFYRYIKERGYAIYPGKLTEMDTFRIGNIGEIYPEDIDKLTGIIAAFLKERKEQIG